MSRWFSLVATCRNAHDVLSMAPKTSAEIMSAYLFGMTESSPKQVLFVCGVVDGWDRTIEALHGNIEDIGIKLSDGASVGILSSIGIRERRRLRRSCNPGLYAQQILLDGVLTAEMFASICHGDILFMEKCMGYSLDNFEIEAG